MKRVEETRIQLNEIRGEVKPFKHDGELTQARERTNSRLGKRIRNRRSPYIPELSKNHGV
jgi:hypothetical protein